MTASLRGWVTAHAALAGTWGAAAEAASSKEERGRIVNAAWRAYAPVILAMKSSRSGVFSAIARVLP